MFHIVCTFAMQSRALLSQLSVTGDESGFFMSVYKGSGFCLLYPIGYQHFSYSDDFICSICNLSLHLDNVQ